MNDSAATSDADSRMGILVSEYGVIKTFLNPLPIKELNKLSTVCKAWNETAKIIKKSRHQIYTFANTVSHQDFAGIKELLSTVKSQPSTCIIFLTNYGISDVKPKGSLCLTHKYNSKNCIGTLKRECWS